MSFETYLRLAKYAKHGNHISKIQHQNAHYATADVIKFIYIYKSQQPIKKKQIKRYKRRQTVHGLTSRLHSWVYITEIVEKNSSDL